MCVCVMAEQDPPLNATGLAVPPAYMLLAEVACVLACLYISAIGEIASAYVAIAASSRVKHMRNGDLQ